MIPIEEQNKIIKAIELVLEELKVNIGMVILRTGQDGALLIYINDRKTTKEKLPSILAMNTAKSKSN